MKWMFSDPSSLRCEGSFSSFLLQKNAFLVSYSKIFQKALFNAATSIKDLPHGPSGILAGMSWSPSTTMGGFRMHKWHQPPAPWHPLAQLELFKDVQFFQDLLRTDWSIIGSVWTQYHWAVACCTLNLHPEQQLAAADSGPAWAPPGAIGEVIFDRDIRLGPTNDQLTFQNADINGIKQKMLNINWLYPLANKLGNGKKRRVQQRHQLPFPGMSRRTIGLQILQCKGFVFKMPRCGPSHPKSDLQCPL